jgi:hypothetical protein
MANYLRHLNWNHSLCLILGGRFTPSFLSNQLLFTSLVVVVIHFSSKTTGRSHLSVHLHYCSSSSFSLFSFYYFFLLFLLCIHVLLLLISISSNSISYPSFLRNVLFSLPRTMIVFLWSSGQSSWLQIQRSGFDPRRYQIF